MGAQTVWKIADVRDLGCYEIYLINLRGFNILVVGFTATNDNE